MRECGARAIVSLAVLLLACDEKRPPPLPSTDTPAAMASVFGIDASLGEAVDPPAPAGDLKSDIDRFVNIDTCVAERALVDPLLGDALKAIGYDTFLRDACRLLEAAKDKKRASCDRIDSSALRIKCQTWVAMVAQTPESCPLVAEGRPALGRLPSCLAIASRDPRLCTGEPRLAQRVSCEAIVLRDGTKCDALLAGERMSCTREMRRYQSLLSAPLSGLANFPTAKSDLHLEGLDADAGANETENAIDVSRGVVVVAQGDRLRVQMGQLENSDLLRSTGSPNRRVHVGLALAVEPPALGSPRPKVILERFELDIPGEAPLSCPSSRCTLDVKRAEIGKTRGAEVSVVLSGTIPGAAKSYRVEFEATTFVRDAVNEPHGGVFRPLFDAGH